MNTVTRYDFSSLEAPTARRDADGFLHDTPVVGRVGIQEYKRADGGIRRELRLPDEVFHPDALKSFRGKPITVDHPTVGRVTKDNAHRFTVGTMLAEGRADGEAVRADIVIHAADAIGDRRQLSLGYTCDMEDTPGEWNGQQYDSIQRNIRVNHLSVVKLARAGAMARLNLDSADNAVIEDSSFITQPEHQKMAKIKLDSGLEYEAPAEVIAEVNKLRSDASTAQSTIQAKQKDVDTIAAERDALKARVDALPAELDAAKKEGEKAAAERIKLDGIAATFKVDAAGKTVREVKEAVIKAVHGDAIDPVGKTDAYIDASFDLAVAKKADFNMQSQRMDGKKPPTPADGKKELSSSEKYDAMMAALSQPVKAGA